MKIRNSTRQCKDGTVEETRAFELELRDKNGSLELMGRHHVLWFGEIGDPEEVLSRLTGIPKHLLPTTLEPYINEDVVESSDEDDQSALTLPRESTALPAHLTSNANTEVNHDLETKPQSELPRREMASSEKDGNFEDDDFNRQSSEDKKRPGADALVSYKRMDGTKTR